MSRGLSLHFCGVLTGENLLVVAGNCVAHVGGTAVADFHSASVEYGMIFMLRRKCFDSSDKKVLPMLVFTRSLNGGLNHITLRLRCLGEALRV